MKLGHTAAECTLCPNGTGWSPSSVRAGTNPSLKYCTEKGVKFLAPGDTRASKNAHVKQ